MSFDVCIIIIIIIIIIITRVGLSAILHRAPPQVANRRTLSRCKGYWGNKIPRAGLKTDLQRATCYPEVNHDLGRSGNCKWEAALAKLAIAGDECNGNSYRSETDRRRWKPSCRLSHCDVQGKEKPPHYDLKAATKVL